VPTAIAGAGDTAVAASSNSSPPPCATRTPGWVDRHKIGQIVDIEPLHVATYVCLNGVFDVGRETAKCIQRQ
jgi:hypothetical protein